MWDKVLEDSWVVQEYLKRGEKRGEAHGAVVTRKVLLRQGRLKFGPPDAAAIAAIEGISDLDRLDSLSERLLTVNSWDELLAP